MLRFFGHTADPFDLGLQHRLVLLPIDFSSTNFLLVRFDCPNVLLCVTSCIFPGETVGFRNASLCIVFQSTAGEIAFKIQDSPSHRARNKRKR